MTSDHDCKNLLHELSEYVDGELDPELCAELERHLAECPNCRIVVNTLKKTVELYHNLESGEDLPVEVRQRLYLSLNMRDYLH
jgi:anti-sigma factor (TIGR02949 family)